MNAEDILAHYGIKGMRWGVRRSQAQLDSANPSAPSRVERFKEARAARARTRFSSGAKDAPINLTDDELRSRINRMETEKRYNELNSRTVTTGEKNVMEILTNVGKKTATTALSGAAIYVVAKAVEKKLGKPVDLEPAPEHELVKAIKKGGFKK